jgi:hypothetical protein
MFDIIFYGGYQMTLHPQRCETCALKKSVVVNNHNLSDYCEVTGNDLFWCEKHVSKVGCASHSTAKKGESCDYCNKCIASERKSERDKVLDEVYERLRISCWHKTSWDIMEGVFRELRKREG